MKNTFSIVILFFCLFYSVLFSETRDWDQLYLMIDRPVADMKYSTISGISEYGLLFALPGTGGGLAYFTNQDSLNIFNVASNLGAVSIVPDNLNNRIFCAFGCGSNSDGLYEFDVTTQEFELIGWYFFPHFVKKLSSGFYFGYGDWNMYGGLLHSTNGDEWTAIDFFNSKNVNDVEENGDGSLFIAADNEIYLENNGNYTSFTTPSLITDIYVRNYPYNDEVYIASGGGSYSDAVYRAEYENGEITGLTYICGLFQPNSIYEYEGYLVVGCIDYFSNLYLVEPEENGQVQEIGSELGINGVYCFEFYPIYTPNFMVGTDIGVFLATNLTASSENELTEINSLILLRNYPNPFNPSTTIYFETTSLHNASAWQANLHEETRIEIYNLKGQKIKTFPIPNSSLLIPNQVVWDGKDDNNKPVGSGIYLYKLKTGNFEQTRKMILIK